MITQEAIVEVRNGSETSGAVIKELAERQRYRQATNLNQMEHRLKQKGYKIIHKDFIETFKKLNALKIGKLTVGRRGKPNRFEWYYNLKSVGQSALGAPVDLKPVAKPPTEPAKATTLPKIKLTPKTQSSKPESTSALEAPVDITVTLPAGTRPQDMAVFFNLINSLGK